MVVGDVIPTERPSCERQTLVCDARDVRVIVLGEAAFKERRDHLGVVTEQYTLTVCQTLTYGVADVDPGRRVDRLGAGCPCSPVVSHRRRQVAGSGQYGCQPCMDESSVAGHVDARQQAISSPTGFVDTASAGDRLEAGNLDLESAWILGADRCQRLVVQLERHRRRDGSQITGRVSQQVDGVVSGRLVGHAPKARAGHGARGPAESVISRMPEPACDRYVSPMSTAARLLIAYGVTVICFGLLLGVPLARVRSATPQSPRHLVTTHLSALMQGPVALGFAFAITAATFDSSLATIAAVVLVAGLALEALGGTLNWLRGTGDQFAERSPGFFANALSGPLTIVGAIVLVIGTLIGL